MCAPAMSCFSRFLSKQTFDTFFWLCTSVSVCRSWMAACGIGLFSPDSVCVPLLPFPTVLCHSLPHSLATLTFCPQAWGPHCSFPVIQSICLLRDTCSNHPATGLCSFTPVHTCRFCFLCCLKDLSCLSVVSITSASIF